MRIRTFKKLEPKFFMTKHNLIKTFYVGQKVLLCDFRLHIFPVKLRSRCSGPFVIKHEYPYRAIDIENPKNDNVYKINGQILKHF